MIQTIKKTTLTDFPVYSRPVLTKRVYAEFNAISGRLGSKVVLRKQKPNREYVLT